MLWLQVGVKCRGVYRISFSRPLFKCLSDSCIVNPGHRSSI